MPSNKVVINSGIEYEVPDSFMEPLMAYLDMVKEKCTPKDDGPAAETGSDDSLSILVPGSVTVKEESKDDTEDDNRHDC